MTFDQLNQAFDAFCKWTFNTSVHVTALIALVWLAQWFFGQRLPPRWRYVLSVLVVLRLVAQGWTNREIAAELQLSAGTVKVHVERILAKLGVSHRTQAAVRAVEMGILVGDTTANGTVNSSDISQTQSQSGQSPTLNNFREDVTVSGLINSSDISLVQSQSGMALPSPAPSLTPADASLAGRNRGHTSSAKPER